MGQVAITPSGYMTIKDVIDGAQHILQVAPNPRSRDRQIQFAKVYPDGTTFVVLTAAEKKNF